MRRVAKISFLLIILLPVLSGRVQAQDSDELPPWKYDADDYEYSGELNAVLIMEGTEVKTGYLGAFVGEECRGYVEVQRFWANRRWVFTLLIVSNVSEGETISFRYYDDEQERVYFVKETLPFVNGMKVGSIWDPEEYHISENSPPEVENPLPDLELDEYFGSVDIDLEDVFSDEDGDSLALSVLSSDTAVVTVSLRGNILTIHETGLGTSTITVTATDDGTPVLSTNESFKVTVNNVNDPPVVDNPLPDVVLDEHFGTFIVDLTGVFSDKDEDPLTFSASSSNSAVVTVSVEGTTLTITETGPGSSYVTVTASDGSLSVDEQFGVTVNNVNEPPEVNQPVPDQHLEEGFGTKKISIAKVFRDPDGDVLEYTASVDDPSVVTVSLSGTSLEISEAGIGVTVVTICASDGEFEVCDTFNVAVEDVNFSPVADCSQFSDTVEFYGSGVFTVESLCDLFSDPDGDELTYAVTSSDPSVAEASMDGCSMDVTVYGPGIATFTLCAGDGEFEVCCAFDLLVVEENRMELFVMDRQLFEGDTIGHYPNPDTVVLIVFSGVPWDVESADEWFTVEKINPYNAEIAFSENTTGAARSGSVSVRDSQEHVVNLVVYQSAGGGVTSVAAVSGSFGVRCYPNPVEGRLFIDTGERLRRGMKVEVIDQQGKLLFVEEYFADAPGTPLDIDMRGYTAGTYFIRISDENDSFTWKIFKQ